MTDLRPRILVTGADLAPQATDLLSGYEIVYAGAKPTENDLIDLVEKFDPVAVIVRYGRITPAILEAARSLRVISKHGSGTDTIDIEAATARGIQVRAAVGANAAAVAEHAIGLLLACAKSIPALDSRTHAGHWDKATHKSIELEGRTLGLIGLGAIGRKVANIAAAMGMRVIGFDPFAQQAPDNVELVDMDTIWDESDAISLHCPLTHENRGLVNAQSLARCKDGVLLVNTARGGLIDEAALVEAIIRGKVASAGIDSFSAEPPSPDHVFFGVAGMILTPHIGGVSSDAYVKMGCAAARNVIAVLGA